MRTENYKFEPGARAIIQMGEELIGHPTTAINELVKNGYDADATTASVFLNYNKDNKKSFLVISDNGLGMSPEILFGDWLQPSISKKRGTNLKSKILERNFLGSKGIGRLAAMALGQYLTVITKTSEEKEYSWLTIDREKFKQGGLLSSINFPGGSIESPHELFLNNFIIDKKSGIFNQELLDYFELAKIKNFTEGTIIVIEYLDNSIRTMIEEEFVNAEVLLENMSLVRALRVLITPLFLNSKIQEELITKKLLDKKLEISLPESVFEIKFGSNLLKSKYPNGFVPIEEFEILANYDYRLLGKVSKDGSISGIYNCNRLVEDTFETEFQIKGKETFSDESTRVRKIEQIGQNAMENKAGEFFFDLRIYDRDPDALDRLSKILHTSGKREAGYALDSFVGLRISKNGFGVKPYGEEEKDWMGLGEMRVQDPTAVLGVNQIIGNVFLYSPYNDSLNEKTNREGFFENEAFIIFKKILRTVLKEAGQRRYNFRQKHGIGRKILSKHNKPDSTRFLEFIKTLTSDKNQIETAQKYIDEITTTLDNLENSLTFSQRLATLGSGLELVYHELAQPITILGSSINLMRFPIGKIGSNELRDEFLEEIVQLRRANELLSRLKDSLEPAIGKARRADFKPLDTFNKVCYLFTKEFIDDQITVEIDDNLNNYVLRDFEYFFWIGFLNIINNAVYWLKQSTNNRKICFKISDDETIIISNTGPKIDESELDNIFNYGVSHKKIKNATGLGLSFTRSLLSANGWEIWAENKDDGPAFYISKNKP